MLAAPALTGLLELDLRYCRLSADAADLLAAWPGLRSVRRLLLGGNRLTEHDAERIARSPYASERTTVSLDLNP